MGNRFLLWLGAGAVCAGVTVGMLAGAGTAFAQTDSDGGDGGTNTSQSTKTTDAQQVSSSTEAPKKDAKPAFVRDVVKAVDAVDDAVTKVVTSAGERNRPTVAQSGARTTTTKAGSGRGAANLVNDVVAAVSHQLDRTAVTEKPRTPAPVEKVDATDPAATIDRVETTPAVVDDNTAPPIADRFTKAFTAVAAFTPQRANLTLPTAAPLQSTAAAAAAPQPQIDVPPLISALGTAVFGLISFAESVFEGPPMALPGSGVTVKRSTLKIGDQEVPADWYFPDTYDPASDAPPERIIYLQHGFLARGVFYDYTASYLAESTNSVVVAPTLTSNIFATDGMWLGGDQMHRAAAELFNDDNTALLESAREAGYTQDQLPQNLVLVGHSLGGGFAIDTARYMRQNQANGDSTYYKLAGVVMLDGVSFTDPVPILEDLDGVPVYNLSSTPNPWNLFGAMDHALAQVRGDQPHGAQLFGSWHSDAMIGGNPLIQLGAYLLTGYGGPANVQGSQILAAGWINDLFACQAGGDCDASGFYGDPGSSFRVPTPFGPAIALVQPSHGPAISFARDLTGAFFVLLGHINFATDVDEAPASLVAAASAPRGIDADDSAQIAA